MTVGAQVSASLAGARMRAMTTGAAELVDLRQAVSDESPRGTVTMRRAGADVPRNLRVGSTLAALAPLEGRPSEGEPGAAEPSAAEPAEPGAALAHLLNRDGLDRLEREHGEAVERAPDLPATTAVDVASSSELGKRLGQMSIRDVATQSQDEFV